jgi:hypothetical protein
VLDGSTAGLSFPDRLEQGVELTSDRESLHETAGLDEASDGPAGHEPNGSIRRHATAW